ncbi:MAG: 4-carboxymuconolactone decarboxylase [Acidobacteria bacterium]|nr:4-carboxymuconolactone decarboxylase [Acidobacteriota bacterium]|tara:strand:+ start:2705 stop:3118 length:414 start_codon:yes stop_codon:yes gene_type:complete
MTTTLDQDGLQARRRVLGDEYVNQAITGLDTFNIEFQQLVTEYCWGKIWTRSTLDDRQRSLINLSMIAALNRADEFKTHVRGALRNGCTIEEIRDTLLQVAVYCGIPAGVEAFRLARQVLDTEGVTPSANSASEETK